jgi:hypothetical protein
LDVATADRVSLCGSDSDCLVLHTVKKGNRLKIDGLDLTTDKVEHLLKKIPSWFGPRPATFILREERLLNDHETLEEQGAVIGDRVKMVKTGDWSAGGKDDEL